ncbi:glutathione S-transferase family protein [Pelagibius sp. CAU 1746]|uniref:glutathione S-transferase family protein n=1 Tax=Pelagibius sp. CAU 1746 TaxID=3140370 RepID=UPI00325A60EC
MTGYTLIPKLILGNKTYSSWSLRGWLPVRQAGLDVTEVVIPLRRPETRAEILKHSPTGKVPTLIADDEPIWDSLAIAETLAERFPDKGLWPAGARARQVARSVTAEMHSGFPALRRDLPMDLGRHHPGHRIGAETQADIGRICDIWRDCRANFGGGGDFLFGDFCIADAFYAPVVTRFRTYDVTLDAVCEAYCAAVTAHPWMQEWSAAAAEEPWVIDFD